jgi:hypothetical protein
MRDSTSSAIAALAVIMCCALPLILLSGAFTLGGGLALNQQIFLIVGLVLILVGGVSWLLLRRRKWENSPEPRKKGSEADSSVASTRNVLS